MSKQEQNFWIGVEDLADPSKRDSSKETFFELPLANTLAEELPQIEEGKEEDSGSSRRDFLKYLGFGLGAATIAASCKTPVKKGIPYTTKPDSIVPGVATYYATSFVNGGDYCPILVKNREGRPIKVEGNSLSTITEGGTSARAQASVLDLYNERSRIQNPSTTISGLEASWDKIDAYLAKSLASGKSVRILSHTNMSPSSKLAQAKFVEKYPNTKVVSYDPVSSSAMLEANEASFGKRAIPSYDFSKANRIVSFGADFLGTWISPVEFAKGYSKNRKASSSKSKMSRHYQFESAMTLTGSNADNRVLVKPSEQGVAIAALYNAVAKDTGSAKVFANHKFSNSNVDKSISRIAADLISNKGKSLVVSASNNVAEQILVNKINHLLGNYGSTVDIVNHSNQRQGYDADVKQLIADMNAGAVNTLFVVDANPAFELPNAKAFNTGLAKVATKVAFASTDNETTAAADIVLPTNHYLESWGDVEPKLGSFSFVQPVIEPLYNTRQAEQTFLNLTFGADAPTYADFVKSNWSANTFASQGRFLSFNSFWDNILHDGVYTSSSSSDATPEFVANVSALASQITKPLSSGELEVTFFESVNIGAGQYATNPWLQEMPDPVTRCVWGNYLLVPVNWDGDNNFLGFNKLDHGDIVDFTVNGVTVQLPVVLQFGQMNGTCAVAIGYGREKVGKLGENIGTDVNQMIPASGDMFAKAIVSEKVGKDDEFACVQYHHTFGVRGEFTGESDDIAVGEEINADERVLGHKGYQGSLTERSVFFHATLPELDGVIDDVKKKREHYQKLNRYTLYKDRAEVRDFNAKEGHFTEEIKDKNGVVVSAGKNSDTEYTNDQPAIHDSKHFEQGHHWGMNVDLSSCIGCGACQVACVAENNVPVVGKREVHRHHEMTWLRIDRYYYGDVENPNSVYMPMMCQHCDNAPCENVCPVAATNHSAEGLNQMTYNRCVGTRYCANNCPYKVRRFNWYDYTTADLFPYNENKLNGEDDAFYSNNWVRMVLNPDVTVRSRGVIEKCSFCVQRIQESKLAAKVEKRSLRDGDVKTACQSACPTDAIQFGDMNDKNSKVAILNNDNRNYKVLEEVNTNSSVGYLLKVTNRDEKLS